MAMVRDIFLFVEGRKVREINILWWGPWLDRVRTSLTDLERNI